MSRQSESYAAQVDLLLEVLPVLAKHTAFAVKGGTALNLFYLDMPRLSVDIDLCYLPIRDRKESFQDMHRILGEMKTNIETLGFEALATKPLNGEREARLNVSRDKVVIKIEPNYVLRGCLFEQTIALGAWNCRENCLSSTIACVLYQKLGRNIYGFLRSLWAPTV